MKTKMMVVMLFFSIKLYGQCPNIDFSTGDLSQWVGERGNFAWPAYTYSPISSNPSYIPYASGGMPDGILAAYGLMTAPPGKNSIMLGDFTTPGSFYDQVEYNILVNPSNSLVLYSFAAVFEDPGANHSVIDMPKFQIDVIDPASGTSLGCAFQEYHTDPLDAELRGPYSVAGTTVYFRSWTTSGLDLSAYMGLPVTLRFRVQDCAQGAHFGYAYVTAECAEPKIDIQYCYNNSQATLTAPAGFQYQWYFMDATGTTHTGPNTQIFNYNNPDPCNRVWCDLSSQGGCPFTINAKLEPSILTADFKSDVDICLGKTVDFINKSITYNFCDPAKVVNINSWEWDFGDGSAHDFTQNPAPHNYAVSGVYDVTLTVKNDQDCQESITKKVYVWDPKADFTTTDVCFGQTVNFIDASIIQILGTTPNPVISNNITTFEWDFDDASAHNFSQNPNHTYATPGAYNVTLHIQTDKGCQASITKLVNLWNLPVADFIPTGICKGTPVNFADASVAGSGIMSSYLWNFGDGGNAVLANPIHIFNGAVEYDVQLIVTNSYGCIDDTVKRISIVEAQADFTCNPACYGEQSLFFNNSVTTGAPITNFTWDFADIPSGANNISSLENPTHVFSIPGSQFVTFTIITPEGCNAQVQKKIEVLQNPVVKFSSNIDEGCPILCVDFTDFSTSGDPITEWTWNIDNHYYSTQNPQHCFDESGMRDVELTVTSSKGCKSTLLKADMINIFATPIAEFSYSPNPIYSKNPAVEFTNLSSGAIGYTWTFDHFGNSTEINPKDTFPFDTAGIYRVCLEAMGSNGCPDTACKNIEVLGMYEFMATNTFTPNGDGINDDFRPVILGSDQDHFQYWIYNRWGELIYTSNYYTPWDGTYQGKLVKEDVYVWKVIARDLSTGDEHEYYGHVLALINTGRH